MTSRLALTGDMRAYFTGYADERAFIPAFLELLGQESCYERTHLPGHITGSAWIVDRQYSHTLLTHHAKLHRWLQPGGHADGDEDILRVAMKEAVEETGLSSLKIASPSIFDIDIHPIPASGDFQAHLHYDIRILMTADRNEPLTVSEESHELAWIPLQDVGNITAGNISIGRMVEKSIGLSRRWENPATSS